MSRFGTKWPGLLAVGMLSGGLFFGVGYWLGLETRISDEPVLVQTPAPIASSGRPVRSGEIDRFDALATRRDWVGLASHVEAGAAEGNAVFAVRRARLLGLAATLASAGEVEAAVAMLVQFVANNPKDNEAHLLLARQQEALQQFDAAVASYFAVLDYPDTRNMAQIARQRLEQLIERVVRAGREAERYSQLVTFFENLVLRDPANDAFRLERARWLAFTGALDAAEDALREVGTNGVTQADVDGVRDHLRWRHSAIDVESLDGQLIASVVMAGREARRPREARLLVDTGASMTALNQEFLNRLDASAVPGRVQVHTAGGLVTARRYRVQNFKAGAVVFDELTVLALPAAVQRADGLLGMDVLRATGIPDTKLAPMPSTR